MARTSLHRFYVTTPTLLPPAFFYVMANPIHYTQNSGFPSVTSWRAVDYMKIMCEPQISSPRFGMYVMFFPVLEQVSLITRIFASPASSGPIQAFILEARGVLFFWSHLSYDLNFSHPIVFPFLVFAGTPSCFPVESALSFRCSLCRLSPSEAWNIFAIYTAPSWGWESKPRRCGVSALNSRHKDQLAFLFLSCAN